MWTSSKRGEQRRREKVKATCEKGESDRAMPDQCLWEVGFREKEAMYVTILLLFNEVGCTQDSLVGIRERELHFKSWHRKGTQEGRSPSQK